MEFFHIVGFQELCLWKNTSQWCKENIFLPLYNFNTKKDIYIFLEKHSPPPKKTKVSVAYCLPILRPSCWLIFLPTGPATPVMAATEAGFMTGMASKLTVLVPELKYMYMYLHKEFAKI